MPRTYSKTGCTTCKRRKRKCDERKPICISCARFDLPCSYEALPSPSARRTAPSSLGPFEVQRCPMTMLTAMPSRRWYRKTNSGWLHDVGRGIECDEKPSSCNQCVREGLVSGLASGCQREAQHERLKCDLHTVTPSPSPRMYVARVSSQTEVLAFEYFDLNILPMFRICQPSVLWDVTVGFSAQTGDTLRHIAIALGFHQRLAEGLVDDTPTPYLPSGYQAEVLYGRAVRALQEVTDTVLEVEGPAIALCCLLMVALECLRSSPKSLLLHLRSAVRIVVQMAQWGKQMHMGEMIDVITLLQQSCDMDFHRLNDLGFSLQGSSTTSLEVHNAISQTIHTLRQLMHPLLRAEDRIPLFCQLYRCRARTVEIRNDLMSQYEDTANHGFLEAKLMMTEIFLNAMLVHPKDNEAERRGFWRVLDRIENSLLKLRSARPANPAFAGSHPFAMSTASIHMLESIIRSGHGGMLEERAVDLLKLCPLREGLWNTEWILRSHHVRKSTRGQHVPPTQTLAIKEDDRLASWEDCVDIAQEMLENVSLNDNN